MPELRFGKTFFSNVWMCFVKCLQVNKTLSVLLLGDSHIGNSGAKRMVQTMDKNSTLTTVDVFGNDDIGTEVTRELEDAVRRNQKAKNK
jgi:hypothetical protein